MSKTLSNGTLSLRFMKNASRAKQEKEAELERAQILDDSKWVLPGPKASRSTIDTTEEVAYEPSYLPFLFPSLPDPSLEDNEPSGSSVRLKGRRIFKKGIEVQPAAETRTDDEPPQAKPEITPVKGNAFSRPISRLGSQSDKPKSLKPEQNEKAMRKVNPEIVPEVTTGRGDKQKAIGKSESKPQFVKPAGIEERPSAKRRLGEEPGAENAGTKKRKKKKQT